MGRGHSADFCPHGQREKSCWFPVFQRELKKRKIKKKGGRRRKRQEPLQCGLLPDPNFELAQAQFHHTKPSQRRGKRRAIAARRV